MASPWHVLLQVPHLMHFSLLTSTLAIICFVPMTPSIAPRGQRYLHQKRGARRFRPSITENISAIGIICLKTGCSNASTVPTITE